MAVSKQMRVSYRLGNAQLERAAVLDEVYCLKIGRYIPKHAATQNKSPCCNAHLFTSIIELVR